jgi:hypothetical protein
MVIGFYLDDCPADPIEEQHGTDQVGGDGVHAAGEERAAKGPEARHCGQRRMLLAVELCRMSQKQDRPATKV